MTKQFNPATFFLSASNVPSQESYRSCICVLGVMYMCVSGHVYVCQGSCICVLEVMYMCVRGHVYVCQRSYICVLGVMYMCVRGHVYVGQGSCICILGASILPLFLSFFHWILKFFSFYFMINELWCLTPLSKKDFSYILAVIFIGGGNRSTQRKPPTCLTSLTNFII